MGAKKIKQPKKAQVKVVTVVDTPTERLRLWFEKNYHILVGVAAALLFGIISFWGVNAYQQHAETKAQAELANIVSKLPAQSKTSPEELQKVIPELEKFVAEHKGTQAVVLARVELGRAFFGTQRHEDAIKALSQALEAIPAGQSFGLSRLVRYQLALVYEAAGKNDQALKEWMEIRAAGGDSGLEREAEWHIGRIQAAKNDYSKAAENYSKAMSLPGAYPPNPLIEQELAGARQLSGGAKQPEKQDSPGK